MMGRFRKKPVVVLAAPVHEIREVVTQMPGALPLWLRKPTTDGTIVFLEGGGVSVLTREGRMSGQEADWIICGVAGEFYCCQPEIFAQTYEVAE